MIDPSKIMQDGCTMCRRQAPFEDEGLPPLRMTAFDSFDAHGLKRVYICEYCDHLTKELELSIAQTVKALIEKFIEEHAKLEE